MSHVVGAGSAGAIIATRLTEDPKVSVLLLEAGGSEMKNNNILKPELVGSLMFSDVDWEFYTVTQKYSQKAMKDQVTCPKYPSRAIHCLKHD